MVNKNKINIKLLIFIGMLLLVMVGVAVAINFYKPAPTTPGKGPILNWVCKGPINDAVKAANNEWTKAGGHREKAIEDNNKVWVGTNNSTCLNKENLKNPQYLINNCSGGLVEQIKNQTITDNNKVWVGDATKCLENNLDDAQNLISNCGGRVGNVVNANNKLWEGQVGKLTNQLRNIRNGITWNIPKTSGYYYVREFRVFTPEKYLFFDKIIKVNYILVGGGGAGADGTVAGAGGGGGEGGEIKTGTIDLNPGYYKVTVGEGGKDDNLEGQGRETYLQKFDYDTPYNGIVNLTTILVAFGGSKGLTGGEVIPLKSGTYASDALGGKGGGAGGGNLCDIKNRDGTTFISGQGAKNIGTKSGGGHGGSKTGTNVNIDNGGGGARQTIKDFNNADVTNYGNGGGGGGGTCSSATQGKGGLGSENGSFGKGGDGATTDNCTYRQTNGNPGGFPGGGGGGGGGGTATYPAGKGGVGGDGVLYIFYNL